MMGYDIFISYHRKSGSEIARMLQQALSRKGYRCFLDVDSVRDGEFQDKILNALRSAPNFLFVLTSGALDRISDPADHIRIELEEALRLGRKVVITAPRGCRSGFSGLNLPDALNVLKKIQVTLLDVEVFFEKSVEMIEARFAKCKPRVKTHLILSAIGTVLLMLTAGVLLCLRYENAGEDPYADETYLVVPDDEPPVLVDDSAEIILKRMKGLCLPEISFKPPATIRDAVDFFRAASKDYDRPDLPIEKRGFEFILFPIANDEDDFNVASANLSPIPTITASQIALYDALQLICESVDYKFVVHNGKVLVMPLTMATEPLETRIYKVSDRLIEVLADWLKYDYQDMKANVSIPKDDENELSHRLREFLSEFDIVWYDGSGLKYLLSVGEISICNTARELHKIEVVLSRQKVLKEILHRQKRN